MTLCDAYSACLDAPDPFACANNTAVTTTYACTVFYSLDAPSSVCPFAAALLPHSSTIDPLCRWLLAPVNNRPRYDAVLGGDPSGTGGGPISSLCQPYFIVRDTIPAPPVPDSFLLLQSQDGTNTQMFRILLTPQAATNGCPQVGLDCPENLPPP